MTFRILRLPSELRVKIFEEIIHSVPAHPDPPTDTSTPAAIIFKQTYVAKRVAASRDLEDYRGLILSCKDIFLEFEYEWRRIFNAWVNDNLNIYQRLIFTQVTHIHDSVHLRIGLAEQTGGWLVNPTALSPAIALLIENLPSFYLYPVTSYPPDRGPLTPSQIQRVKLGRKGRRHSEFLHVMKLLAVKVYQEDFVALEHFPDIGEDYQVVAMNWAWDTVTEERIGLVRWAGMDWRNRVVYGS